MLFRSVTVDQLYKIVYPGTTNFRTIGSHSNEQGTIFTAKRNVAFTDTGDLVTYNNHNLVNGDTIKFSTITTTTGISINTTYYVINVKKNTFQLSLTSGGSAIALTNNGTGIIVAAGTGVVIPEAPETPFPVSNYEYESQVNESKRRIKLISAQNLFQILAQFKSLV